jgi:hypothetical protein
MQALIGKVQNIDLVPDSSRLEPKTGDVYSERESTGYAMSGPKPVVTVPDGTLHLQDQRLVQDRP